MGETAIYIREHVRTYRKSDLVEITSVNLDNSFRAITGEGWEGKYILIQALVRVDALETKRALPERLLKSARYRPQPSISLLPNRKGETT